LARHAEQLRGRNLYKILDEKPAGQKVLENLSRWWEGAKSLRVSK
jgi:hypothetical protein